MRIIKVSGALLISFILVLTMFSACGKNAGTQSSETSTVATETTTTTDTQSDSDELEWKQDTSPITLSLYSNFTFSPDAPADLWGKDPISKLITKKTGVTLNIIKPPSDDGIKLSLMISSNDLPDMILLGKNDNKIEQMIDGGMLYSYDELIDQYAPNFKKILPPEILSNYKYKDGKTYKYVNWAEFANYMEAAKKYNALIGTNQAVMLIRPDYLEEIGSPDISTPDTFIEALVKIKEKHPDKIPFYGGDSCFTNGSVGHVGVYFGVTGLDENDQLKWRPNTKQYMDTIMFLNKLVSKNLLTRDSFIDSRDVQARKVADGNIVSYTWTAAETGRALFDNPDRKYTVVPPFSTYKEIRAGTGWQAIVITKKAEKPDRVIRFVQYMASYEGHVDHTYGIEGDKFGDLVNGPHFKMVDGKPTHFPEYVKMKFEDWSPVGVKTGLGVWGFFSQTLDAMQAFWNPEDKEMESLNKMFAKYVEYKPEIEVIFPADAKEIVIGQKLGEIEKEYVSKMVFAKDENAVKTVYAEMIAKAEKAGLADYEALYGKLYQENKKRLGK